MTLDHIGIEYEQPQLITDMCGGFGGKLENADCEAAQESPWAYVSVPLKQLGPPEFGRQEDMLVIPTALLGLYLFTGTAVWLILMGGTTARRWWIHLLYVCGMAAALGGSVFFEIVMWKELESWCPECLTTHVGVLLLFLFSLMLWPRRERAAAAPPPPGPPGRGPAPSRQQTAPEKPAYPPLRMLLITPAVAAVIMLGEWLILVRMVDKAEAAEKPTPQIIVPPDAMDSEPGEGESPGDTTTQPTAAGAGEQSVEALRDRVEKLEKEAARQKAYSEYWKKQFKRYDKKWQHAYLSWVMTPRVDIPTEGEPARGPADARHTLVVFSDFQCPHCRKFEAFFEEKVMPIANQTGGIRLIFKHWPISQDCNPHALNNSHPKACKASLALEAARLVGGEEAYWKMYDLLWKNQKEWLKSMSFAPYARQIGLDESAFQQAMASDEAIERVTRNCNEGEMLGKDTLDEEEYEFVHVNGTPAVYLDGKRIWRLQRHPEFWRRLLTTSPPKQNGNGGEAETN
jgi:protein-disulfide isomerase